MTVSMVMCMLIAERNNESYESVSGLKCVCMCVYMCVCAHSSTELGVCPILLQYYSKKVCNCMG